MKTLNRFGENEELDVFAELDDEGYENESGDVDLEELAQLAGE